MHLLRHWLHRRLRAKRFALLDLLLHTQSLSRQEILRKQKQDVADIVSYAARNTTYYAEKFAPLMNNRVAEEAVPLGALPILSKEDVRGRLDDLLANDADRSQVKLGHTGGSTGQPLGFWYDDAKHELMRAGMCRSYMMAGWQPGEKILNFWGARQDTQIGGVFGAGWSDFIAAEKTIAAFEYTEQQMHEWSAFVRSYQPVLLQGYASVLTEFARFVIATRQVMPKTLRGVFSTAEVLGSWQRELIERAFGCKVFNQYGSREIPNIACECRHGRMHVFTDMVYLESLAEDADDTTRLLVTSLTNRLMPFIRYDIGDSGRLLAGEENQCDCGSPFPLMEMGMCRHNDLIRTPGGKRIHPSYFNRLLAHLPQIRQYQCIQNAIDKLTLIMVASPPLPPESIDTLRMHIAKDIDAGMQLEISCVDEIPRTASGKHRYVISHCH
jgi:phenylacetate-CoA ligase